MDYKYYPKFIVRLKDVVKVKGGKLIKDPLFYKFYLDGDTLYLPKEYLGFYLIYYIRKSGYIEHKFINKHEIATIALRNWRRFHTKIQKEKILYNDRDTIF